jgi:hypothetical protein
MLEKQYHDELKMEIDGVAFSSLSNKEANKSPDAKDDTQSDHEADAIKQEEKDDDDIGTALMSRKQQGLYKAMKVCVLSLAVYLYALLVFNVNMVTSPGNALYGNNFRSC